MTADPGRPEVDVTGPASEPARADRGLPIVIVITATAMVFVLYLLIVALVVGAGATDASSLSAALERFLIGGQGWLPPFLFLLLMLLAALLLQRRGVTAWLLASLMIGLIVWGTSFLVPVLLLASQADRPAPEMLIFAVTYWPAVVAGVLAREAALWAGLLLVWRYRRRAARSVRSAEHVPGA